MVSKKIGWVSAAIMAAACSGGGGGSETPAPPPGDIGTPPPTAPPAQNMPPVASSTDVRAQLDGGSISVPINVSDPDGDSVELVLLDAPDWVSLSDNGQLTGTPDVDQLGSYEVSIEASDGTNTSQITLTLTLFMDPVEQALATGDYTYITEYTDKTVPSVLLDEIEAVRARNNSAITGLFQLNSDGSLREDSLAELDWHINEATSPVHFRSPIALPYSNHPYNFPILSPKQNGKNVHVGLLGEIENARFMLLGGEPVSGSFQDDNQLHHVIKNAIDWLTEPNMDEELNVVLAHIEADSDAQRWRNWLTSTFPETVGFNSRTLCDAASFSTCINDEVDLMIIYQDADLGMVDQVRQAMNRGIPVIFVFRYNQDTPFGEGMLDLLGGFTWGLLYPWHVEFKRDSELDYIYSFEPDYVEAISRVVRGIESESLDYDLSVCSGPYDCPEHELYQAEVSEALSALPTILDNIDLHHVNPFETHNQNRILAALLLTGDYYRSLTQFPMPTDTTPSWEIVRAILGENAASLHRKVNPAMPDMGTYSRSQFDVERLSEETVVLTSAEPFKTSGLYALPGETFTVSREDTAEATTCVRVQTLNLASGDPFRTVEGTQYRRPQRITSNCIPIESFEELHLTSPFGGPIHIGFNTYGEEVELEFSNVAKHPVWRGPQDTETFLIDLSADQFDWAEFVTPYFEVHSTVENMNDTLSHFSGPSELAEAINTYLHDWPRWLHGQQGEGITENTGMIAFHEAVELPIQAPYESIQHVNVEQASCEEGCAGNPYDTLSDFVPNSYESMREIGHELSHELLRLRDGTEGTLPDVFAAHGQYRQFLETGEVPTDCRPLPHAEVYNLLQAAYASGNPEQYMDEADLNEPDHQAVFYIQLMAALQNQGALEDGWEHLARLNVHTRLVERDSYGTSFSFNEIREGLGYANYVFTSFNLSDKWNRVMHAMGWTAQRNLKPIYEMWGVTYHSHAEYFANSNGLSELEPIFYAIPPTGHCTGLDHPELPIDGVTTWPN